MHFFFFRFFFWGFAELFICKELVCHKVKRRYYNRDYARGDILRELSVGHIDARLPYGLAQRPYALLKVQYVKEEPGEQGCQKQSRESIHNIESEQNLPAFDSLIAFKDKPAVDVDNLEDANQDILLRQTN